MHWDGRRAVVHINGASAMLLIVVSNWQCFVVSHCCSNFIHFVFNRHPIIIVGPWSMLMHRICRGAKGVKWLTTTRLTGRHCLPIVIAIDESCADSRVETVEQINIESNQFNGLYGPMCEIGSPVCGYAIGQCAYEHAFSMRCAQIAD